MKHVDVFLLEVIKDNFYLPNIEWDHKDKKILESLGHQLKSGVFLTENQGNLLVKLLLQYKTDLEKFTTLSLEFLNSPEWSKSFRLITVSRNIFLNPAELTEIYMEFSYNKKIKEKLFDQQKKIQGTITHHKNNVYSVSLTEKNVCTLVEAFKDQGFKIDQKLISFYEEIQNIKNSSEINFNITRSINTHLIEKLKEDIGHDHTNCPILLHDRKLRFQYEYSEFLEENSLVNLIAKRTDTDTFISSVTHEFKDVILALSKLQRFPLLIIFDSYHVDLCKKLLDQIHTTFLSADLKEKIGIYFRLDNASNKDFNTKIAELGYNCYLDSETQLVGLSNKQLPKFLVKSGWKPKSIICFSPTFKNSKIYSYCDSVDLKICYTESKPVSGFDYAIM